MLCQIKTQNIDKKCETIGKIDRISKLPDTVISHILFYLSAKDAARTTILSKDWLRIWQSLPVCDFVFDQSSFEDDLRLREELEEEKKVQKFIDFINESLSMLLRQKVIVQSFTLNMMNYRNSSSYQHMIMSWLSLITKNCVKKITLNKASTRPLLEAASSWAKRKFGYSKLPWKLKCLQELSLTFDYAKENGLENGLDHILKCCSSLETLILKGNMYRESDSLSLSRLFVKNIRVENIFKLHLSHVTLHRVRISSSDLQSLHFCHIDYALHFGDNVDAWKIKNNEVVIDIDAPNLRQFSYDGDILVSFTSDVLNFSCLERCQLTTSPCYDLPTSWFIQLRKYLEMFSNVHLTIYNETDALFQRYETMSQPQKGSSITSLPPNIRLLRIYCLRRLSNYEDLVDGLLWSCRPDTIIAYASNQMDPFLEFFNRELMKIKGEETLPCCKDPQGFKCWRHCIRAVEISTRWEDCLLNVSLRWSH